MFAKALCLVVSALLGSETQKQELVTQVDHCLLGSLSLSENICQLLEKMRFCVEGLIIYLPSVNERCYGFQTKPLFHVLLIDYQTLALKSRGHTTDRQHFCS